jgi:saccharopine dehydrogenase-like NADP-dependent oxidoreductase
VMRVAIVGCGTVGRRAAEQLCRMQAVEVLTLVDSDANQAESVRRAVSMTSGVQVEVADDVLHLEPGSSPIAVLVATPAPHGPLAMQLSQRGIAVISTSDDLDDVRAMLSMNADPSLVGRIVVGVGFAPGLTDVLAKHGAASFDQVREVHTAKFGTAGPACARQHHFALAHESFDFRDGAWLQRPGGSGRELAWFPGQIGGADCYRAALPDAVLLQRLFPEATRLSARMAATRRDRLTARLPMLRRPHAEAQLGAVRVEVRGSIDGEERTLVLAGSARPSAITGAVAAIATRMVIADLTARSGADGNRAILSLGEYADPVPFLAELLEAGFRCERFEGTTER